MTPDDGKPRAPHWDEFNEKGAHMNRLKHSVIYHSVPIWNKLPATMAEAGFIDTFNTRLSAPLSAYAEKYFINTLISTQWANICVRF